MIAGEIQGAFANLGIALGIGALIYKIQEFGREAALTGARTETLAVAMETIGRNFGVSTDTLYYFVEQLKKMGITTGESQKAVAMFITQGFPLDKIIQLADVARNQAVLIGRNTSEVFEEIVMAMASGQVRVLKHLMLNIGNLDQVFRQALGDAFTSMHEIDPITRNLIILDQVLRVGQRTSGAYEAAMGTVGKQMHSLARYSEEAKNALWPLFQPIMIGLIESMTTAYKDLKAWAEQNKDTLKEWGKAIGVWVIWVAQTIRSIITWIATNRELLKSLVELWVASKVAGWIIGIGTACVAAYEGLKKLALGVFVVKEAMGGWLGTLIKIIAALAIYGAYQTFKKPTPLEEYTDEELQAMGEAWVLAGPKPKKWAPPITGPGVGGTIAGAVPKEEIDMAKIEAEGKAALDKLKKEFENFGKTGAKAGKDFTGYFLSELKAGRAVDIATAEAGLKQMKEETDTKKLLLEQQWEFGKKTGEEYYAELARLEQEDYNRSQALIQLKIVAENEYYEAAKKQLELSERDPERLKAELGRTELEHKKEMIRLQGEQNKLTQDHLQSQTKSTTEFLKQQKEVKETLAGLQSRLGLTELEREQTTINDLTREEIKLREDLIKKRATEAQLAELAATFDRLKFEATTGKMIMGYVQVVQGFFSDLFSAIINGQKDLKNVLNRFFQNLFNEALKPGFKQLELWLKDTFESLFEGMGEEIFSAVMGVVAIVGMLLTSGGGKAEWSPAGIQSAVTGHEAVRGIIAGETSIPIAEIGLSLAEAMLPTNSILYQIEENTRGGGRGDGRGGGGGSRGLTINVNVPDLQEIIGQALAQYFQTTLQLGVS
jgi:hypothetical protein